MTSDSPPVDFPVLNISFEAWEFWIAGELLFVADEYDCPSDPQLFREYYQDQIFADCGGRLFRMTKRVMVRVPVLWFFRRKRLRHVFEDTRRHLSFSELRELLLSRVQSMEPCEFRDRLEQDYRKAATIPQLVGRDPI